MRLAIAIGLLLVCSLPHAETLTAKPKVIDADTMAIDGKRIRLEGIDAPEIRQECENRNGDKYRCGDTATRALRLYIGTSEVRCETTGRDRYGRFLGTCYKSETDINRWLVREGHAVAYRRYTSRYAVVEDGAKSAKRGIWQGRFIAPEKWRRGERLTEPGNE